MSGVASGRWPSQEHRIAGPHQPFDLAEARLLQGARRGERAAASALWERVVDDLWSIALEMREEEDAVALLAAVRGAFLDRLRGLPMSSAWREQVFALLWQRIAEDMEPLDLDGISSSAPPTSASELSMGAPLPQDARSRVRRAIREAPPELRMVYLFSTLGGQDAAAIAGYSGLPEGEVRAARARMAWWVVSALRGEGP